MTLLALALLLLAPVATAVACRLLRSAAQRDATNVAGCCVTAAAGYLLAAGVFMGGPVFAADGSLAVDALSAYMVVLVVTVALLAGLYSPAYLRHDIAHEGLQPQRTAEYYLWYHLFLWTMLLVTVMNNLGLLWAAIEATTVVSAMLVGFYQSKAALEAAWKYLMLCSVGITIALFGVLLTYYAALAAGGPVSLNWTDLATISPQLDPKFMRLALVFVVIGFGTKAGFAPLHAWLPDAHSQAPSPVSAVLSGVLLSCALYGILRFVAIAAPSVGPGLPKALLVGFGMLSVAVAVPFLLVQRDLKRLLAYSSVEHIGLSTLAIGIGGPLGLYAGLLHLMNHALVKAFLFLLTGNIVQRYGTRRIAGIQGLLTVAPVTGTLLLTGALAITGMPPLSIFVSEFGIVAAGAAQSMWPAVALVVLLLAVSFVAIIYHALRMVLGGEGKAQAVIESSLLRRLALALPLGGMVALGLVVPAPVTAALGQAVAQLLPAGVPAW